MALKLLPSRGIELSLDEYTKLRAFQGGGWFWDHESQQVIRDCLGEFLPRVEEHGDPGGALFQHFAGGSEVASKSRAAGQQMDRVPKSQLDRLQRAIESLKRKTQDPNADPNARQIIERFRLPDPAKDPELYRLYGSPWNRKLLVLWGCERESGTSLAPFSALSKMPVEPLTTTWLRRLPLVAGLLLLLLLLLAVLIITLLPHRPNDGSHERAYPSQGGAPVATGQPDTPLPLAGAPVANQDQLPPATPAATTPDRATNPPAVPQAGSLPADGQAAPGTPATLEKQTPLTGQNSSSAGQPAATLAPLSASGAPASAVLPPGTGKLPVIRDHSAPKVSDPEKTSTENTSGTPMGPARSTGRAEEKHSPEARASSPAAGLATPVSKTAAVVPAVSPRLEIISVKNSPSPKGGKVDASMAVIVHAEGNAGGPVRTTGWSIDGVPQLDSAGQPATASEFSASLTPGKHRVRVTAVSGSGEPLAMESEMDVQIRTQSDVKIKPGSTR